MSEKTPLTLGNPDSPTARALWYVYYLENKKLNAAILKKNATIKRLKEAQRADEKSERFVGALWGAGLTLIAYLLAKVLYAVMTR